MDQETRFVEVSPGRLFVTKLGMRQGFSLLEILVVLAVIGMLSGLVVPEISRWLSVAERNKIRQEVVLGLESLSFEAYRSGNTIELSGQMAADNPKLAGLPLKLPADWSLKLNRPIQWHYSGVCSGGGLELLGPDHWQESITLVPPHCQAATQTAP